MSRITSISPAFLFSLVLAAYLLFQWPFLDADPQQIRFFGRDAHTDEALGLNQVINWVATDTLSFHEGDNLLKNPLFNAHQALALSVAGNSRVTARVMVLLLLTLVLYLLSRLGRRYSLFLVLFTCLGLTGYHTFQYYHFSMPELVCALLILTGIMLLTGWLSGETPSPRRFVLVHLVFAFAWWEKSQYVYAASLPVLALGFQALSRTRETAPQRKEAWRWFLLSLLLTLGGGLLFFLVWYLPNRELFGYVMGEMLHSRFAPAGIFWAEVKTTLHRAFLDPAGRVLTWVFLGSLLAGTWCLVKGDKTYRAGLGLLLLWCLLESHKLAIRWVPDRYLVTTWTAMGAFSAWVILELLRQARLYRNHLLWVPTLLFTVVLFTGNAYSCWKLFRERTYVLKSVNRAMREVDFRHRPALGSWAPSLTWGAKVRTMPVWKDYMNDTDVISLYHPRLIVTEKDEGDANGMYKARGLNLEALADSVSEVRTGGWTLRLYWLR